MRPRSGSIVLVAALVALTLALAGCERVWEWRGSEAAVVNDVAGLLSVEQRAHMERVHGLLRADHDLAVKLWESGNHDARILATMVADPKAADGPLLEAWVKQLDNYIVADAFAGDIHGEIGAGRVIKASNRALEAEVGTTSGSSNVDRPCFTG